MEIEFWKGIVYAGYCTGLSRLYKGRNNLVLGFHSVRESEESYGFGIPQQAFRNRVAYIADHHVPVDLPEVLGKQEKRVAFTFDDGYQGFYKYALPVLEEFQVPATVFVNADFIGGANEKTRLANLKNEEPVMTEAQIEDLIDHPLVTIGNHTRTHHPLDAHHDRNIIKDEIVGGRKMLEDRFDITVDRFCYPYGPHNGTSAELARHAHRFVLSERRGHVRQDTFATRLPRVNAERGWPFFLWKTSDMSEWFRRFL